VEAKASDRFVDRPQELKALIEFCHDNHLRGVLVTTRTRQEHRSYKNVELHFMPASLYCFLVGYHTVLSRLFDSERAARGGKVVIRGGLPWEVPIGS
jgi:hypothetical protein